MVLQDQGRLGIVVPGAFHTDLGCCKLRQLFFGKSHIDSIYSFENKNAIFNIHRSLKFDLFSTSKVGHTHSFRCAFMERDPECLAAIEESAFVMTVEQVRNSHQIV